MWNDFGEKSGGPSARIVIRGEENRGTKREEKRCAMDFKDVFYANQFN